MVKLKQCKESIVEYIKNNPGVILDEFKEKHNSSFEENAKDPKNWERIEKEVCDIPHKSFHKVPEAQNLQVFDCTPYSGKLKALVFDNNSDIIKIVIYGD